jgi:hypothetical protein
MYTKMFNPAIIPAVASGGRRIMDAPDPNLILAIAAELQNVHVGNARAAELAAELGRLNAAVLRETDTLRFEDEPAHFVRALEAAAR